MSVTYVIDGNLDGKGWVTYATLGTVEEDAAVQVYESWLESRDLAGWGLKYRLVRRVIEQEVMREEA